MKKCIITVVGKDTVGIIAKVCTYLAENQIKYQALVDLMNQEFSRYKMVLSQTS